jgi:D-3-phosphoglycerate dehydrogenase
MTNASGQLHVVLVDLDKKTVPEWVPRQLQQEQIDFAYRDCTTRAELADAARDADVVWLFGGSRILQGNLDVVPRCWAILRTGSGTDNVPVDEATRRGIVVANTPAAFSDPVSDHVIALLFAAMRRIPFQDRAVRQGQWDQTLGQPLCSIQGKTLGLVGFGGIAREVAKKLAGFSLRIMAFDPFVSPEAMSCCGVQPAELNALLAEADFVSLHCPLTPETKHLIGESQLRSMKPTAILVNTSRGPIVDELALARALAEGWIAAAGLDVVEHEPLAANHPFLGLDNVVLTPHSAGLSANGVEIRWRLSFETVLAFSRREWPASCVNHHVKPAQNLSSATDIKG